jgi:cytochrome P450
MALKAYHRLCKKLDKAKADNTVVEMAEEFRHLTLQVIAEALLSLSPEESDKTFATMYIPIVEEGNARTWHPERMYLPTPSWFKFKRDVKILNDYVTNLIEKRWILRQEEQNRLREHDHPPERPFDILDKILEPISDESWDKETIMQARDEIKTFVLAGHETSASMLTWTLYELFMNPQYLRRVQQEADTAFQEHTDPVTGRVISWPSKASLRDFLQEKLVFTECCLRESLRKYSIVPTVVRMTADEVALGENILPKGQTVMILMQGVHHNPKYWPEPLRYNPERFLEDIKPYTFLAFIEGARVCLGQHLSLLESKIILALLVKTYRFEVMDPEEAGIKHPYMVPIIPKTGHHMKIYDSE